MTTANISMINPTGVTPLTIDFRATMDGPTDTCKFNISKDGMLMTYVGTACLQYDDGTSACECNCVLIDQGTYSASFSAYKDDVEVITSVINIPIVVTEPIAWNPDFGFRSMGRSVTFFDTSEVDASSYSWSFGDGSISTKKTPTHNYKRIGSYGVGLTVSFQKQTKSIFKNVSARY